jgi:hypothetical protein
LYFDNRRGAGFMMLCYGGVGFWLVTRDHSSLEPTEIAPSKIYWANAQLLLRLR